MDRLNVRDLPVASNVCEQVLREVEKQPRWSMAHVTMNPLASSLLHIHKRTTEVYVITKGFGELETGIRGVEGNYAQVTAGSVTVIEPDVRHLLRNKGVGQLEHLVFALPPFDPTDVELVTGEYSTHEVYPLSIPRPADCFDGAKIISHYMEQPDLSIAFGWVTSEVVRRKRPHYHKQTTEFIYVVDGSGYLELDRALQPIRVGDWIRIPPGTEHRLVNESAEDLVVVCACSPAFQMEDVYYRD